jgi:hypothetical protein
MNAPADYRSFLEAKVKLAPADGFHVDMADINPALKPHVRVAVQWACAGGRRAFFARFGMQKTTWHLEVMRLALKQTGRPVLIVVPLGARVSFFNDASRSPALLAPVDPATDEGASGDVRGHAPPASNSVSCGDPTRSLPSGESEPAVTSAYSPSEAPGADAAPLGFDAGAAASRREPIELPNPFNWTDPGAANIVVGKHDATSAAVPDARAASSPGARASTPFNDDYPELPEKLRRKRAAA